MSQRSASDGGDQSVLDLLDDWYHVPVLVAVMTVMFWIRMQSYSNFLRDGEVLFSGNDAWYHYREVVYTVKHYPSTIPFDPWTYFPYGTFVGQFGTLYDQIVATIALVIGLGSPSEALIAKTLVVAPAVFGALAVIPVYLLGKRFGGRAGGLFGALVLMLLPGTFLFRTLAGVADHNAVEPFFMGIAVFGLLRAYGVAERSMPVWEVVQEEVVENRDLDTLREPTKWAAIAGFLTGIYLWVWPPGVILVGIVGVFVLVKVTSDVVNNHTPEPVAYATAVAMGVVALMSLLVVDSLGFETTIMSLLQVLAPLGVAAAGVGLSWLARYWEGQDLSTSLYPAAVAGIVVVGVVVVWLVARPVLQLVSGNLLRIVGFSAGAATRTIGEAQPFISQNALRRFGVGAGGRIMLEYGLTFFTALGAAIWLHARPLLEKGEQREYGYVAGSLALAALIFLAPGLLAGVESVTGIDEQVAGLLLVSALLVGATLMARYDAEPLFLLVWAAFLTSMAFTQIRFNYYLAIPVAVLNAALFGQFVRWLDLPSGARSLAEDIEGYQVLAVVAAALLVLGPALAVPITLGGSSTQTAVSAGSGNGPGAVTQWGGTFDWMRNNTPEEGTFGGADNRMEYYGSYERTGDFDYPEGAYGVMSWWDYGHWITVQGKRIPNANPFQEGATRAANFLLAPSESRAQDALDEGNPQATNEPTRYVMVDWQMASVFSKFGAPTVFYDAEEGVNSSTFYQPMYQVSQERGISFGFYVYQQRYYESMMIRLYRYHGSAMEPAPIVVDWQERTFTNQRTGEDVTLKVAPRGNQSAVRVFDNMSAARQYVKEDGSAQIGGVGQFPTERVPALQHYRLVKVSNATSNRYFLNELRAAQMTNPLLFQFIRGTVPSWVKTFEKVPGATIHGTNAPPNTTVTASVRMRMPTANSTFVYSQQAETDENGNFTLVLPYSTTGYDNYGPANGYTNVSVRAETNYTVTAPSTVNESGYIVQYGQNFSVREGRVNGDIESAKVVTLEKKVRQPGGGNDSQNGTDSGNQSLAGVGEGWDPGDFDSPTDTAPSTDGPSTGFGGFDTGVGGFDLGGFDGPLAATEPSLTVSDAHIGSAQDAPAHLAAP